MHSINSIPGVTSKPKLDKKIRPKKVLIFSYISGNGIF